MIGLYTVGLKSNKDKFTFTGTKYLDNLNWNSILKNNISIVPLFLYVIDRFRKLKLFFYELNFSVKRNNLKKLSWRQNKKKKKMISKLHYWRQQLNSKIPISKTNVYIMIFVHIVYVFLKSNTGIMNRFLAKYASWQSQHSPWILIFDLAQLLLATRHHSIYTLLMR